MSNDNSGAALRWSQATWWRPTIRIAAILGPVATCAVIAGFRDSITQATSALVLVLWVVAAAATGDRVAGFLAAASGGIGLDFFLTEPYLRFTIDDRDDIEATVLLVLIGLAVTEIALWGRRQQAQSSRRSGYLDGVLQTAGAIARDGGTADGAIAIARRQICRVLGVDDCRYVEGPLHDPRIAVLGLDGGLTRGDHLLDVGRDGLPTDDYVAILVRRGDVTTGHFLVAAATRVARPNLEQRRVAALLADQVAATHERRPGR